MRVLSVRRLVTAGAVAASLAASTVGGSHAAALPLLGVATPPPQPTAGTPGGDGSCGLAESSVPNPRPGATLPVHVYEPTGTAAAVQGGGRCDGSKRPTVFVAHGFGLSDPASYRALVVHLVSVGNVVVYPSYDVRDHDGDGDTDRADLEESYRVVDEGLLAAVGATPRVDTSRVGWWGHSHGGGMIPWLVQQGAARGWGTRALWMSNVAQAYTQLVGEGAISVPAHAQSMTVAFEHDALADKRLGIDVYESLTLPPDQKRHVMVKTDVHGQPPMLAEHGAPSAGDGQADAIDFLLWRYADLLERCALTRRDCDLDLSTTGTWSDGVPVVRAEVSVRPVDSGPMPAILAECDALFATGGAPLIDLNPRRARCGPAHL
jgi:hypothetical protein